MTKIKSFLITEKVSSIDTGVFEQSSVDTIESRSSFFIIENNLLINKNTKSVLACPPNINLETVNIPDNIVLLEVASFADTICKYVNIPSTVQSINNYCFTRSKIVSITIPDSVISLGGAVFLDCTSLTNAVLPSGLTTLNDGCFQNTAISQITIPSSITFIGTNCFLLCWNLNEIVLPDCLKSLGGKICSANTVLKFGDNSNLYILDQVLVLDKSNTTINQYIGPNNAVDINILSTVSVINQYAFRDLTNIRSITFPPNSVLRCLNDGCFYNCINMKFIGLPNTIEFIGNLAFGKCNGLTAFTSAALNEIKTQSFLDCVNLADVNIMDAPLSTLTESCFEGCASLQSIVLPQNIAVLEKNCFSRCTKLNSVTFQSTLTTIGEGCFKNCGLTIADLHMCVNIASIEDSVFSQNEKLTKIILPPNLKTFSFESFAQTSITNLSLPSSVTKIGNSAFRGCRFISTFVIPSDSLLKTIGVGAFRDCSSISEITCDSPNFKILTGGLFDPAMTTLILFPPASSIKYFSLPGTTRTINEGAFMSCTNIISIFIPSNSVTIISNNAFEGCVNLRQVNIPASVQTVGQNVFLNCKSLTCGLEIESSNKEFISSLISSSKLPKTCILPCEGFATQNCYSVYYKGSILTYMIIIIM